MPNAKEEIRLPSPADPGALSFHGKDEMIYVIGHRHPDADSVGSAMALAHLLTDRKSVV